MNPTVVKLIEQAVIVALIAVLSFAVQASATLGPYGPIIGSVETILLTVAKVAAQLSPRPF